MEGKLEQLAREGDRQVSPDFPFVDGITDVAIIVQDTILYVNKGVLCVASPVFHTMLTSDFKEKDGIVNLPEKIVEDVTLLLKMIYPNMHVSLNETTAQKILPLAAEYMMEVLIQKCDRLLAKKVPHFERYDKQSKIDRLMNFVNYGCIYHMKLVQEAALKELAKWKTSCVEKQKLYGNFSNDVKMKIQRNRIEKLEEGCESVANFRREFYDFSLCECYTAFSYWNRVEPPRIRCGSCKSNMQFAKCLDIAIKKFEKMELLHQNTDELY